MDKLHFESANLTVANVKKIAGLFPGAVTEGKVNFDLLRSMLGDEVYGDEAYEFTWVGKRAAIAEAGRPIRKTLRPCKEESKNWDTTENLYIEGDNLDVLKLLQESYLGKVKMIYIDPPYNTGNDFVYRDNFTRDKDEYDEEAGVYDEDGDRLFRNTESNGRFHSDWCSMMYPRLVLARNLLSNDGVIFVSIDDNEVAQLRKICDEVFGESNFVCQFIWKSKLGKVGTTQTISTTHEYILCYGKHIESLSFRMIEKDIEGRRENLRQWGQADRREDRPSMYYPITIDGIKVYPIKEDGTDGRWRVGKEMSNELLQNGMLELVKKETRYEIYRNFEAGISVIPYDTLLLDEIGTTAKGSLVLKEHGMNKIFDYSKPFQLIRFFSYLCTEKDSFILDFFSGSATTAHAVMQLNAEDGGKRRFIMVQLPESCAPDSEAAKAGYANICEIGKERIRRAGEKIVDSLQLSDNSKEAMKQHGCIKLSRSDCSAKSDGTDGSDLFSGQEIAKRGNLRFVGSDETSGSVNSLEHSGGARKKHEQGIHSISGNSTGIKGGIGDSIIDLHQGGIPCRFGHFGSDRIDTGNWQNAECPHYKTENCPLKTVHYQLDIGFRVLKLDDTNMKDVYYAAGEYTQDLLSMMEDNIKDDRTDMDLLYACLLDWGLPLSMPHTQEEIGGFTVHTYNDGDLIACFDKNISEAVIKEIARRQPLRAVFRDSSFISSPEKINVEEIFKLLAPNTSVKVL
jgi:adenine-specific DNA-methyltransferase